jgi:hypothetical protein
LVCLVLFLGYCSGRGSWSGSSWRGSGSWLLGSSPAAAEKDVVMLTGGCNGFVYYLYLVELLSVLHDLLFLNRRIVSQLLQ